MNTHLSGAAALAVFLATTAAIGAQNTTTGTTGQSSSSTAPATTTGDLRVNVIGCVERTPATKADNTTTIVPEGETRYVLTNVTLAGRDTAGGRQPDSRGDLLAEAVNQYRLDDTADAMIAPHVGNRVEVSGRVMPQPAGTSGRATPSTPAGPVLKVEHIEKVSEGSGTCRR